MKSVNHYPDDFKCLADSKKFESARSPPDFSGGHSGGTRIN